MKLIYKDIYETIDTSISDSQIGSRKGKNIIYHVWVLNSIICDTLSSKSKKPIDIQIYDYKQCFDGLWLEECLNDMYSGGLSDNKFNLLHSANKHVNFAVKTPVGKTDLESITNVIIQGDVFGPMLCSKQVDTFGKECLEKGKYTFLYKGEIQIPPLAMVDDVVCVAECGFKSFKCLAMFVDSWQEQEIKSENGENKIGDICIGTEVMEEKKDEKYLGDIISNDGRNLKNIKARVHKGRGIVNKIMKILDEIPLGKLYFQIAIILRNKLD